MSGALLRGFLSAGLRKPEDASACVRSPTSRAALERLSIREVHGDALKGGAARVAQGSRVLLLGVKPQGLPPVLEALAPHVTPEHLIISVVAGAQLSTLEKALGPEARVARVMPNTPCLVGEGASAYALGAKATEADAATIEELFGAVGLIVKVEEWQMDAVTGVSGSGPAYAFTAIDALADGGVAAGLPRATAIKLAAQTLLGAATMVLKSDPEGITHPAVLKDRVASPAGTTIAGVAALEQAGVRNAFIQAVKAAAARSKELS